MDDYEFFNVNSDWKIEEYTKKMLKFKEKEEVTKTNTKPILMQLIYSQLEK